MKGYERSEFSWRVITMLSGKKVFGKLKSKFSNFRIGTKIMMFYCVISIFSVMLSSALYQGFYSDILSSKVSEASMQTLYSINSNIESMIENCRNLSKVISSSDGIQKTLAENGSKAMNNGERELATKLIISEDIDKEREIKIQVSKFIEAFPFISSVYIFDNDSRRYGIDKILLKSLKESDIKKSPWYTDAVNAKGGYILRLNAENVFDDKTGGKYLSLIRIINDVNTQEKLGVLIININEESFVSSYKDIVNKYDTDIMIIDGAGNAIVDFQHAPEFDISNFLESSSKNSNSAVVERPLNKDYLISSLRVDKYNWQIISTIPFKELSKESSIFSVIAISIIALNSLLLFLGSIIVTRMITIPIKKLLKSMKGIEKGEFKKVEIIAGSAEITKLQDGYNIMIFEIQKLIERKVEDQKIKRKAELDVLQAQIKPHFLYNTFDAISSLALLGRNDEVYKVMKALGNYYRISLNKGREVITIAEEIEVVRNYLTILKVRYGDMFEVDYNIDENATKFKILKLVLQPLVENAIYHGIKPKGEPGKITISANYYGDKVVITVEDNGVGIDEEVMNWQLDSKNAREPNSSFGLSGTIERLRIFYGLNEPVTIESKKYEGTKVIISIPVGEEKENVQRFA